MSSLIYLYYIVLFQCFNLLCEVVKHIQIYHMQWQFSKTSGALTFFPLFSNNIYLAVLQHPLINVPLIFIFKSQEWENKFDSPLNLS